MKLAATHSQDGLVADLNFLDFLIDARCNSFSDGLVADLKSIDCSSIERVRSVFD